MSVAIATAVAAGATAIGDISAGNAASSSAKYNAKIAENNASIARQNADFQGAEGEQQVGTEGLKTAATAGSIKANQGASGIDVNTGSNVQVQQSQAMLGKLDAMTVRSNAARRAYGFQTQATSDEAQAQLDRSQASYDKTAGYIKAGTALLSQGALAGASGTFDAWGAQQSGSALNSASLEMTRPDSGFGSTASPVWQE